MRNHDLCTRLTIIFALLLGGLNVLAVICRYPVYGLIAAGFFAAKNLGRSGVSDSFGSARKATLWELLRKGMIYDGEGGGQFLGTAAYLDPPGKADAIKALFSPALPSELACRLFYAAFLSSRWLEG